MHQLSEIIRSRNLLWNLTLRELKSRYRGSFLGWSWSLLNPISQMLIYTFVFGVMLGVVPPTGDPSKVDVYSFYLLSGIIPWGFFSLTCGLGLQCIVSNAALVKKVYFARETLVLSQVLFSFVQFMIEMSILSIVLLIAGSPILQWLPMTLLLMLLLAVFGTGITFVLAVGSVYFRDLTHFWNIINQVWFFLTPVIYDPARFDGKVNDQLLFLLHWNPPAVYIRSIRQCIYDGRGPDLNDLVVVVCLSGVSFFIGLLTFKKFSRRLAEEI